jgi:aminoglycoside phosphotransferase
MSIKFPFSLPSALEDILKDYRWSKNTIGCTKAKIFYFELENQPSFYLKVVNVSDKIDLYSECTKLRWLKNKLQVPEVIHYSRDKNHEFLLLSEIQGKPSHFFNKEDQKERIVCLLAQGLKLIHNVDLTNCPFDNSLSIQLADVYSKMKNGLVNEQIFDPIRKGRTAKFLYQELLATKPQSEDLIFTHGDYCLPNIILNNNDISGFIDFGLGGISDKYIDIGICVRSISYNFEEKWIPNFLKEYGLDVVDTDKIAFYQLLDEFY